MLLLLGSRTLPETMLPAAIVVNDGVELRSGPGTEFGLQATMPAGAELRVVEARGNWVEVATGAGASGWAPADAVESF